MRAIKAVAYLKNGFSSSDPMSPSIDSMIGFLWAKNNISDSELSSSCGKMITLDRLPIGKEVVGSDWWYQCSMPIYDGTVKYQRFYHRRFDVFHAEKHMKTKKGKIATSSGPTKNFRLSSIVHICPSVEWHFIGNDECIEMLQSITHIGARTGAGEGSVIGWKFSDGSEDIARKLRPIPADYSESIGVVGYNMYWGYRPAVRLPENKAICTIPEVSMLGGEDGGTKR